MSAVRPFRVVTDKPWIAERFTEVGAECDLGTEIYAAEALETVWWAPGAWAASARSAGVRLPLLSCGPHWLSGLPSAFVGRRVATGPLWRLGLHNNIDGLGDRVFVKLPEVKLPAVPAATYYGRYLSATLAQFHLPPDTLIQVQEPVEFVAEMRCWVVRSRVRTFSWYRIDDQIWGSDDWSPPPHNAPTTLRILHFAQEVARSAAAPPGYVLDVGLTIDGRWLVVEANPAWSAGPYDGDPAGILEAITAAHDFDGRYPEWSWEPSPALQRAGSLAVIR